MYPELPLASLVQYWMSRFRRRPPCRGLGYNHSMSQPFPELSPSLAAFEAFRAPEAAREWAIKASDYRMWSVRVLLAHTLAEFMAAHPKHVVGVKVWRFGKTMPSRPRRLQDNVEAILSEKAQASDRTTHRLLGELDKKMRAINAAARPEWEDVELVSWLLPDNDFILTKPCAVEALRGLHAPSAAVVEQERMRAALPESEPSGRGPRL